MYWTYTYTLEFLIAQYVRLYIKWDVDLKESIRYQKMRRKGNFNQLAEYMNEFYC